MQYKQAHSFNKSPPFPMWSQSLLLTLWLLAITTNSLLASWVHSLLLTGFWESLLCGAVYTCSCPVWVHLACLTSWPPQPWDRVPHTLALVLQSVLLEGARERCELEVVESSSAM